MVVLQFDRIWKARHVINNKANSEKWKEYLE